MKRLLLAAAVAVVALFSATEANAQHPHRNSFWPRFSDYRISQTMTQTPYGYGYSTTYHSPGITTTYFQGPQIMPYGGGYGSSYGYQPYGYGYFGGPGFYGSTTTYNQWGW